MHIQRELENRYMISRCFIVLNYFLLVCRHPDIKSIKLLINHFHLSQSHICFHNHSCTQFLFSIPYSQKSLNRGRPVGDVFYGLAVLVAFWEFFVGQFFSDDAFNQYPFGIWPMSCSVV